MQHNTMKKINSNIEMTGEYHVHTLTPHILLNKPAMLYQKPSSTSPDLRITLFGQKSNESSRNF